jgi:hypothetical protein
MAEVMPTNYLWCASTRAAVASPVRALQVRSNARQMLRYIRGTKSVPSVARHYKQSPAKKKRRDMPGAGKQRTAQSFFFFLPFFFFLSFFLDLSFFGCSIVPVQLGDPQRHSQIFFSSLVCFSSRRMP